MSDILNEDEARKKWCPFATVVAFDHAQTMLPVAVNRTRGLGEQPLCLGSGCIAWISDVKRIRHGSCGLVNAGNGMKAAAAPVDRG